MIIGLSGYAQSGKDTVAEFLVKERGFTRLSFADPIREALLKLNPIVGEDIFAIRVLDIIDEHGWDGYKNIPGYGSEIRTLLQNLGTEVGREMFGENFWVDLLMDKIKNKRGNFVVTDVRFENEANAIRSLGGEIWRINRPDNQPVNSHLSEVALDDYDKFSFIITNDTTVEDLFSELTLILDGMWVHNDS